MKKTIGDFLKEKRLERNISPQEVYKNTRMTTEKLEKLENNQFDIFLGNIYVKGYIQNLCELYKIDVIEPLSLYEEQSNKKVTVPMNKQQTLEQSLDQDSELKIKKKFFKYIVWTGIPLILITAILLNFYFKTKNQKELNYQNTKSTSSESIVYQMASGTEGFDLRELDVVSVYYGEEYQNIILKKHEESSIEIEVSGVHYSMVEGGHLNIDFDQDGDNDLLIEFRKENGNLVYVFFQLYNYENRYTSYDNLLKNKEKIAVGKETYKLIEYRSKIPIQIYIKAGRLPSYIDYMIDGSRQNKVLLETGKHIFINAEDTMEITIGNFKSTSIVLNKIPIELTHDSDGKYSVTKIIKWVKQPNNETKYDLEIRDYISQ